jgi:glycosyltransferase involved in cell wall biosynthesis
MESSDNYKYYFTIFIPAYNRATTLGKTLESVRQSTSGDFEVIIIDDGSTDDTPELVNKWLVLAEFPIRCIRQENRGKMQAHNVALAHAEGLLFMTLDAGDLLLTDGLARIRDQWENIPEEERNTLAGIGALCLREDGSIAGRIFPDQGRDASHLEMLEYTGEKRYAILRYRAKSTSDQTSFSKGWLTITIFDS